VWARTPGTWRPEWTTARPSGTPAAPARSPDPSPPSAADHPTAMRPPLADAVVCEGTGLIETFLAQESEHLAQDEWSFRRHETTKPPRSRAPCAGTANVRCRSVDTALWFCGEPCGPQVRVDCAVRWKQ